MFESDDRKITFSRMVPAHAIEFHHVLRKSRKTYRNILHGSFEASFSFAKGAWWRYWRC